MKSEPILFADDEPNVLWAFERRLRNRYHLQTSTEPRKALEMVAKGGPTRWLSRISGCPG